MRTIETQGGINIFQVWKSRKRILLSNFAVCYKLQREKNRRPINYLSLNHQIYTKILIFRM